MELSSFTPKPSVGESQTTRFIHPNTVRQCSFSSPTAIMFAALAFPLVMGTDVFIPLMKFAAQSGWLPEEAGTGTLSSCLHWHTFGAGEPWHSPDDR